MMTETTASQHSASSILPDRVNVVLLEDNNFLRQSLADYLRQRNMIVTEAVSGKDFHAVFDPRHHDVAVLDVNLPDTSGFQLASRIRERSDIGIIILTARTRREDRLRGYGEGADIYFTKPVDSEELALAIGNLARRTRRLAEPAEAVPAAERDRASSSVLDRQKQSLMTPDGVIVKLSTRETTFLAYIATSPNIIVSRADIAAIFGEDTASSSSRVTDVAMARLRSRLRQAGIELPVQVVRNTGYRLVARLEVV